MTVHILLYDAPMNETHILGVYTTSIKAAQAHDSIDSKYKSSSYVAKWVVDDIPRLIGDDVREKKP